ncbi:unnamed protein product, partial [Laminaria digitata]
GGGGGAAAAATEAEHLVLEMGNRSVGDSLGQPCFEELERRAGDSAEEDCDGPTSLSELADSSGALERYSDDNDDMDQMQTFGEQYSRSESDGVDCAQG